MDENKKDSPTTEKEGYIIVSRKDLSDEMLDQLSKHEISPQDLNGRRLKELTLGNLIFEANGVKYFIESAISPERYKQMELLSVHLGFGQTYNSLNEKFIEIEEHLNDTDWVSAAVVSRNARVGIAELEGNHHVILRYCAMFINSDEEDRRVFDEVAMNEKIENWLEEGISQESFFKLAVNSVNGLKVSYEKYIQGTFK